MKINNMQSEHQNTTHQQRSFFDANPKMLFAFGLAIGVACTLIIQSAFSAPVGSAENVVVASDPNPAPSAQPTLNNQATPPPTITDSDHVRGNPDAPLTLMVYSDYECPFCKKFHPTANQLIEEYPDDIKLIYRHFPLSFHNPLATTQAHAAECAGELAGNDGFWAMTDEIFETTRSNGNGMTEADLEEIAVDLGISATDYNECMDSGRYNDLIQEHMSGGQAAGVSGTPASFLIDENGGAQLISGAVPYSQIQSIVENVME